MARLQTIKPRLQEATGRQLQSVPSPRERRMTGRKLQERHLRVWSKDPCCAHCGRLCAFPDGFELDHKLPLFQGGADTDDNCQVLCSGPDGCHAKKTTSDLGQTRKRTIGVDG
ncbi:HNH endonuclease family protein [Pseudomonas sp. ATCC 13867]|nr:HNH endonuclease family protein [Pseudomonas sp. ATCC 13867]RFQ15957.1 HNH endonuclease [Pseudomonas sp. ATCC 13867]